MPILLLGLLAVFWTAPVLADDPVIPVATATQAVPTDVLPDSKQIEADLQRLSWEQFRAVIESVPKMKADVDAYGAFGWSYVQANYRTHGWKKNVDRLDEAQRAQLLELIRLARGGK